MIERKPRNSAEALIWRFIDAQNGHDFDATLACFAEDFVRYGEETKWEPFGKESYGEWGRDFNEAFPDWDWDVLDMVSSDDTVAVHLIESGTFAHPWELNGRAIQPNHKKYKDRVVIFFKIRDDLIQSYTNIHSSDFIQCYGDILDEPSLTAAITKQ